MKMSPEALSELRSALEPIDTPELRARYIARDILNGAAVKDIDKRYRWDLLSMALGYRFTCAQYDSRRSSADCEHPAAPVSRAPATRRARVRRIRR